MFVPKMYYFLKHILPIFSKFTRKQENHYTFDVAIKLKVHSVSRRRSIACCSSAGGETAFRGISRRTSARDSRVATLEVPRAFDRYIGIHTVLVTLLFVYVQCAMELFYV